MYNTDIISKVKLHETSEWTQMKKGIPRMYLLRNNVYLCKKRES